MPAIDDPLPTTPTITLAGVVRKDAAGSVVSADGDMTVLQVDADGYLRVTSTGGGGGGGTEYTEDAAAASNPTGTVPILVRQDTPTTNVSADGDNIAQRGTNYGAAYVTVLDSSGNPATFGSGTQYTEGDVDASITGTAMMFEDTTAANTLRTAKGHPTEGLIVSVSNASVDVDVISITDGVSTIILPPTGADNLANGNATIPTSSKNFLYNATDAQWNRQRTAVHGADTTGIGIAPNALLAEYDDTAPTAITENQFGNVRMSSNRNLYGTIRDAAGNERGANVNASNQLSVSVDNSTGGSAVNIQDGGNSITVDGTVTATIAAGASTIAKAEDAASANADTGVPAMAVQKATPANTAGTDGDYEFLQMSAGRLWTSATVDNQFASFTGGGSQSGVLRVTIAQDSTGLLSVDDDGGSLTVDDGGGSITVDGTITATIGAGASTIAKAEDVASADGDVGVPAMAVRKATPANTSGTDGDYEMLQMSAGRLWTSAVLEAGSAAIGKLAANSGVDIGDVDVTSVTPGTTASSLGKAEDAAHTTGDVGVMALAVRSNSAASTSGTDGDYQPLITNTTGHLWVDASGQTLTVGSHAVTNAGTFVVQENGAALTSLQLIDDAISTTGSAITAKGMTACGTDGTNARALKTDTSGELQIDVLTLPASTNTIEVVGDAAHDAGIAGNPVRIGGRALTSDITAVAAGDTCDLITTLLGKLVTIPFANPANTWSYAAASGGITNTTGVTIKAAAGAGIRNYITCLSVINGHATTSTDVQIRDGASGTVLWRGFAQAAGGGVREVFSVPIRGTANTLLEVACGTTGTATYVNVQGFVAAE